MTIYVPDELHERVKSVDSINVSAVCQRALEAEVERRQHLAKLGQDMERVEVYDGRQDRKVAFTGSFAAEHGTVTAYVTSGERIAIYDDRREELHVYDTFAEMVTDLGKHRQELVAEVANALHEEYVFELDI